MNFGALRVVNDDFIAAEENFLRTRITIWKIITVVLSGRVEHQDSLGNKEYIRAGEIQVMSAGSGIIHSEANPSTEEALSLFPDLDLSAGTKSCSPLCHVILFHN